MRKSTNSFKTSMTKHTSLFLSLVIMVTLICTSVAALAVPSPGMLQTLEKVRSEFRSSSSVAPVISNISFPSSVGAYEKFEVDFQLDATYQNPFDPEDINVEGHFIFPDGKEVIVPCFYYDTYIPIDGKTTTVFRASLYQKEAASGWRLRFSAPAGAYRFYITAKDSNAQTAKTEEKSFIITENDSKGYIKVSETNPSYFEHSADGSLFYGSGSNIPYINPSEVKNADKESYEYFYGRARGNSNATRLWICHWRWLEWTPDPDNPETLGYGGLNYYNQMIASMVDRIYSLAEQYNLKIILTLDDNNELAGGDKYDSWKFHPSNVETGGPAADSSDYWVNPQVREIYKKKLRYIAARWGYSSSMWAINQWNDMSNPNENHISYLSDMRDYTHTMFNNWRPIIYASNFGRDADNYMDYLQFGKTLAISKPGVVQESFYTSDLDWFNSVLHDTQWDGLVKGNAARLVWRYMDVEALNSWSIFRSILNFASDIPLNEKMWEKISVHSMAKKDEGGEVFSKIIEVSGYGDIPSFKVRAPQNQFYVNTDEDSQFLMGFAAGNNYQGHVLYGTGGNYEEYRNPPSFHINIPSAGKMIVRAKEVDPGQHTLITTVNGEAGPTLSWNFAEKTHLKPLSNEEQFIEIPLKQGDNTITLDVEGKNFLRISHIFFVLETDSPDGVLSMQGLMSSDKDDAFLYIKNQSHSELYNTILKKPLIDVADFDCIVENLIDGMYNIAFYDPSKGDYIGKTTAESVNGKLNFHIDNIGKDLAIKIRHTSLPFAASVPAFDYAGDLQKIIVTVDNPMMTLGKRQEEIDPGRGTSPILENGRTLVPIRAIIEAFGGSVEWDDKALKVTVTKGDDKVEMWIDKTAAKINGDDMSMDVPPKLVNGRTMLPLRFVSENLGFRVDWDEAAQQIHISQSGAVPAVVPTLNTAAVPGEVKPKPSPDNYKLYDDFLNDKIGEQPANWTIVQGGNENKISVIDGGGGDQCVEINKQSKENVTVTASRDLGNLTGKIVIEASVNVPRNASKTRILYLKNPKGDAVIRFALSYDGSFRTSDGTDNAKATDIKYALNKWYQLKFEIDTDAGVYSLYINDTKVGDSYQLMGNYKEIKTLAFAFSSTGAFELLFDDVRVAK